MWVATQGERSFMPRGMFPRQNDSASPKMRIGTLAARRCAATARP